MKLSHFISGGMAFWFGEMAEHFLPGGLAMGLLVGGLTAVVINAVYERVTA